MKTDSQGNFKQVSAYSRERVQAIKLAIRAWYETVPMPRKINSARLLGVAYRTIALWRSDKRPNNGPSPGSMQKLWQLTENSVFTLLPHEKEVFLRRGFDVPAFPMQVQPAIASSSVRPVASDEKKKDLFAVKAGKLLLGVITSVSVVGDLFQESELSEMPEVVRRKAAEAAGKIVSTFRLSPSDFQEQNARTKSDPENRARMDRILDTFFPNKGVGDGRKG